MPEFGDLLEREMRVIRSPEYGVSDVRRRRERRQRSRRVGNIAFALILAATAAIGLARTLGHLQRKVPAVPPPAGTIVFSRQLSEGQVDLLFTVGPDGSKQVRLMPKGADMFGISPDGSHVLYPDLDATRANFALPGVVDLDGSRARLVRSHVPIGGLWPVAWSPDGTHFVGNAIDRPGSPTIGLYTARASDGQDLVQITSAPGARYDFAIGYSPDGSKILFLRPHDDRSGRKGDAVMDLYVVNADGSGLVQLNPPGTVLGSFDSGVAGTPSRPVLEQRVASWSPDSTRVVFAAALATPDEARSGRQDVPRAAFVVDADGTDAHEISEGGILDAQWSPDGTWIAFSRSHPRRPDVFVVHPDGTGVKNITSSSDGVGSWGPVWSPDSSWLLFERNPGYDQFETELWFANVDGSDLTQLTNRPAEYFSYGWSAREVRDP